MPRIRLLRFVVVFLYWLSIVIALALLIDRTFALSLDSRRTARLHGAVIGGGSVLFILITNVLTRRGRYNQTMERTPTRRSSHILP
jgi:hypothetical protein